jgi:hypothetical protein
MNVIQLNEYISFQPERENDDFIDGRWMDG